MRRGRVIPLREVSRSDPAGVIYGIQGNAGGPVKIGWVLKPTGLKHRLAVLQCGNPAVLRIVWTTPGTQREERSLHKRFTAERIRGEWFNESVLTELREEQAA